MLAWGPRRSESNVCCIYTYSHPSVVPKLGKVALHFVLNYTACYVLRQPGTLEKGDSIPENVHMWMTPMHVQTIQELT